jgi:uncharacterized protein (TIGR03086 family)
MSTRRSRHGHRTPTAPCNDGIVVESVVDVLASALAFTDDVFAAIRDEHRPAPTPCDGYDVEHLAAHLVGGVRWFGGLPAGGPVDPTSVADPDLTDTAPVDAFRPAAARVRQVWTVDHLDRVYALPSGDVRGAGLAAYMAVEVLAHGWDLAVATGRDLRPPEAVSEATLVLAADLGEDVLRVPGMMKAAVLVSADAPAIDRFVAFLGRNPSLQNRPVWYRPLRPAGMEERMR